MSSQIVISSDEVRSKLAAFRHRFLTIAAAKCAVVQATQWTDAFRRGGQPGQKWVPLWAETYVGKVPEAAREKMDKAIGAARKKPASGEQWAKAKARIDKAKRKLVGATSYRKGGQILVDDGQLQGSWHFGYSHIYDTYAVVDGFSSAAYAPLQHKGFKTTKPNCIPLTTAFKVGHTLHANPKDEGFEAGVDYVMAWHGVNVPQRKLIDYDDAANRDEFQVALKAAAKQAARG